MVFESSLSYWEKFKKKGENSGAARVSLLPKAFQSRFHMESTAQPSYTTVTRASDQGFPSTCK